MGGAVRRDPKGVVALQQLLIRDIDENVSNGLAEGYPACCIDWFAYVWWPICVIFWVIDRRPESGDAYKQEVESRLRGRKPSTVHYIQCPKCRA
jgi:hypothetical protein